MQKLCQNAHLGDYYIFVCVCVLYVVYLCVPKNGYIYSAKSQSPFLSSTQPEERHKLTDQSQQPS